MRSRATPASGASRSFRVSRNGLRMDDLVQPFGPAMLALSERQRKFVLAMAADPFGNPTRWARAAGYSDKSEAAKVRGFELIHSKAVEDATLEFARNQLNTLGPIIATFAMLRIARDPKHDKHLKAVEMVANRIGLHEVSEQRHFVEHTDRTSDAVIDRIKAAAAKLGVDPAALLGQNASPMKVIEHQPAKPDG